MDATPEGQAVESTVELLLDQSLLQPIAKATRVRVAARKRLQKSQRLFELSGGNALPRTEKWLEVGFGWQADDRRHGWPGIRRAGGLLPRQHGIRVIVQPLCVNVSKLER